MELAISRTITNFTTKSALKIGSTTKSLTPRLDQQLEQQYLVPLRLITFRMCHEFGVFKQKY